MTARLHGWILLGLLGVSLSCKPSAEELAKKAEAADAADKERARKVRLKREAEEKEKEERPSGIAENSSACPMTAERMIKRMQACGLNMNGITTGKLCSTLGQVKLNFMASRTCEEIDAIMFPK